MASLQFKAAKARARALRAEFAARGEFTQQAFQNALAAKLAEFRGDAFEGFVAKAADEVDAESTRDRDDDQPRLPVVEWDLDGESTSSTTAAASPSGWRSSSTPTRSWRTTTATWRP